MNVFNYVTTPVLYFIFFNYKNDNFHLKNYCFYLIFHEIFVVGTNFCNFCRWYNYNTPGIYAEGYIVFVFPFVRSYVRMFVRSFVRSFVLPSVAWNLCQSFALKFLKWCISQQLLIRKHSYLDHSYPGGLAFTP